MKRHNLIFAYGSNLDSRRMLQRCPTARKVSTATLAGFELTFAARRFSGDGVATVRRSNDPAAAVPGVVWRIDAGDLARLDAAEGFPTVYTRVPLAVHTEPGRAVTAEVYMKCDEQRYAAPSDEYAGFIAAGYREHALGDETLQRALGTGAMVFVYGSLRAGYGNHGHLADAEFIGRDAIDGLALYDLGPYPAATDGTDLVFGEVYRVNAAQLAALDRLEGVPRLYQKHTRKTVNGVRVLVYLMRGAEGRGAYVETGDWTDVHPAGQLDFWRRA